MITTVAVIVACTIGATERTQILEFTSEGCGPCRQMAATVERLNQDGFEIQQIDVDHRPDLANAFAIRQIPSFVIVRDNQVVDKMVGLASHEELADFCRRAHDDAATGRDSVVRGQVDRSREGGTILDRLRNRGLVPGGDPRQEVPFSASTCETGAAAESGACDSTAPGVGPPTSIGPPTVITGVPAAHQVVYPDFTNSMPRGQATPPARGAPLSASHDMSQVGLASPGNAHVLANGAPASVDAAMQKALQATVRIRIEDNEGQSFGTGTVIDVHQEEALVLTCGHIFRAANGTGRIVCDFFAEGAEPAEGKLICYDIRRDVGLISVQPNVTISPMQVGGNGQQPAKGEWVFAVGCNHGESPTVNRNQILAVNRYHGPANLVVRGRPVDGRSGGGLFAMDGTLIGVCNAADQKEDEGLYAALGPVHAELDRAGLAFIYQPQTPLIASSGPESMSGVAASGFMADPPNAGANGISQIPARHAQYEEASQFGNERALPPNAGEPNHHSPRSTDPDELICIIRSRNGTAGQNRVFVIDDPSAGLVHQLSREINQRGRHEATGMQLPAATPPARSEGQWKTYP